MAYVTTYTYLNCFLETTGQLFKNQQTLRIISSIFINTTFFKTRRKCFEMNKKKCLNENSSYQKRKHLHERKI